MEHLFDDFPRLDTAAWAKALKESLQKPEEAAQFVHETIDGIRLKALYREEDMEGMEVQSHEVKPWCSIGQWIHLENISESNQRALEALTGGADWLWFEHVHQPSDKELDRLLKGIELDWGVPLYFDFGESTTASAFLIPAYLEEKGCDLSKMEGGFVLDPISRAAGVGKFEGTPRQTMQVLHRTLEAGLKQMPKFSWLHLHPGWYREAGAGPVQEMAFALGLAAEYLDELSDAGLDQMELLKAMEFRFHQLLSADYFSEIAKIRGFRLLWVEFLRQRACVELPPVLHLQAGLRNKTLYDPHNNLVRAGLECMTALTAGADKISIKPYDHFFRKPNQAAYRWSRNIPLMVRDEARLGGLQDPMAGSYLVETLTQRMAEKAWDLFLEIQGEGGFMRCLETNKIQQMVAFNAEQEEKAFREGRLVLIGSNKHAFKEEKRAGDYRRVLPSEPEEKLQFLKVRPVRLSESLEIERMKLETKETETKG